MVRIPTVCARSSAYPAIKAQMSALGIPQIAIVHGISVAGQPYDVQY